MRPSGLVAVFGAVAAGCGGQAAAPDAGPGHPAWDRGLPPSIYMGERRGLAPARGIIHLHSPYSHDACDGAPRAADGSLNEPCLADLRRALCETSMDFAALTDHNATFADEEWGPELFLARGDDELVTDEHGRPIASRMACDDGRRVLLFVGCEQSVAPIMLDHHPDGDAAARNAVYKQDNPGAVAAARALGGLAWIVHSEDKDPEHLRALAPDGMEIYNLHAAIDPDIREEWLGLDGPEAIRRVVEFAEQDPAGPEPDLALLSILEPQRPSLERWDALLGAGLRVTGGAGTDAHQNALPIMLRDGERGDSYRRMLRWLSNVVLTEDPADPAAIEQGLARGRLLVVFELLGTPVGFDARADLPGGGTAELGDEIAVGDGAVIIATTPAVHGLDARLPAPAIRTVILRADGDGVTEVAAGDGTVTAPADLPGAYRVEVRMVPRHLGPYLGTLGPAYAEVERAWVYASPIYVRP